MRILDSDPKRLHLEGRSLPPQAWWVWGGLFLPGLLALLLLPEANRFVGLVIWIAIWLALLALAPRWLGRTVRVTVDSAAREIVWSRNGQVTQTVKFADVQRFEILALTTSARPYKAFQLVAHLNNATRITLAVDPREAPLQHILQLVRERTRIR